MPSICPGHVTYADRYPPDKPGEEFSDDGRVWKIYYDEAVDFDTKLIHEYKESLDVLLVFVRSILQSRIPERSLIEYTGRFIFRSCHNTSGPILQRRSD